MTEEKQNKWYVYIVECSDNSLYTWITTDLDRRIDEHNNSDKWAKYTKMRRPVNLVYSTELSSKSEASKEEYRIKKLTRQQKIKIINNK